MLKVTNHDCVNILHTGTPTSELMYTQSHLWIRSTGESSEITMGVTDCLLVCCKK